MSISRRRLVSSTAAGITAAAHLGNVAFRSGRKIKWDAKTEQVIGDSAANAFVTREFRAPWKV